MSKEIRWKDVLRELGYTTNGARPDASQTGRSMKLTLKSIELDYMTMARETGEQWTRLTTIDARGTVQLNSGLSVQIKEPLTPDEYEALQQIIASIEKRVVEKIKASI